jgi:hypothetical protein
MSKHFRPWKIDEVQLLLPSVQDYVPEDDLSRLIVTLVREELDLSAISGSYALARETLGTAWTCGGTWPRGSGPRERLRGRS